MHRIPRAPVAALSAACIALAGAVLSASASTAAGRSLDQPAVVEEHYRFHIGRDLPLAGTVGIVSGMAVAGDGTGDAADASGSRIVRFARDGTLLAAWGGQGADVGEMGVGCLGPFMWPTRSHALCGPSDVAIGPDGDVYVADPLGRIQRFKPWGAFVQLWCVLGAADDDPTACRRPARVSAGWWSLAVGPDGRMYVSHAPEYDSLLVLDPNGRRLHVWPWHAGDLAVDGGGRVVVALPDDSSVVVLDADGAELRRIGRYGECIVSAAPFGGPEYRGCNPAGVAIGSEGSVYAVELGGRKDGGSLIRRFSPDGAETKVVIDAVSGFAMRVAVGADGTLFLALMDGGIAVLDPSGSHVTTWTFGPTPTPVPIDARGHGAFDVPAAVAPAGDGVVVVDRARARLQWLSGDGAFVRGDVSVPQGVEPMREPVAVAAVPAGGWVVADAKAADVRMVDASGALGRRWGEGVQPGDAFGVSTSVLSLDDGGFLFSDSVEGRLLKVSADGMDVREWARGVLAARQLGDLNGKRLYAERRIDLARATNGDVLVLDAWARRLLRLRQDQTVQSDLPLDESVGAAVAIAEAASGDYLVLDGTARGVARIAPDGTLRARFGGEDDVRTPVGLVALPDGGSVVIDRGAVDIRVETAGVAHVYSPGGERIASHPLTDGTGQRVDPRDAQRLPSGNLLIAAARGLKGNGLFALEVDPRFEVVREWRTQVSGGWKVLNPGPNDVSVRADGGLLAANGYYGVIDVDAAGATRRVWYTTRHRRGGLVEPAGVAMQPGADGRPRLFVADVGGHRITRFALDGTFETEWSAGPGGEVLDEPRQIAAAPDGTLWVVDAAQHRVVHFTVDGAPLGAVDGVGSEAGALNKPIGIAVAADGSLRVSDALDNGDGRIRAFGADGVALADWSGDGPPGTRLLDPAGLAFGADRTLWTADAAATAGSLPSGGRPLRRGTCGSTGTTRCWMARWRPSARRSSISTGRASRHGRAWRRRGSRCAPNVRHQRRVHVAWPSRCAAARR
ncbi:MAG: NHL repeat-containing protein [Anaerolineae bacterium]